MKASTHEGPQALHEGAQARRRGSVQPSLIFGMSAAEYHADPSSKPSLSASLAHLIITRSERHAFDAHPRLNKNFTQRKPTEEMEDGTALHTLLLGAGTEIVPVGSADWRPDWAQEKRQRTRQEGKVAILTRRLPELTDCAAAVKSELQAHPIAGPELFAPGNAEAVIMCQLGRTYCRTRIDWLPTDPKAYVYDFKFTTGSAAPEAWQRNVWEEYDVQAAMICRCVEAARGVRPPGVRFVVAEMKRPYGVAVLQAAPDVIERGEYRLDEAIERWQAASTSKVWPGYRRQVALVSLPAWMLEQVEDAAFARRQRQAATKPARTRKVIPARPGMQVEPHERLRSG